jgi:hypothetical protein
VVWRSLGTFQTTGTDMHAVSLDGRHKVRTRYRSGSATAFPDTEERSPTKAAHHCPDPMAGRNAAIASSIVTRHRWGSQPVRLFSQQILILMNPSLAGNQCSSIYLNTLTSS